MFKLLFASSSSACFELENKNPYYAPSAYTVYLNGELFDGRVELHAYDIIKLGNTRLLFVPLCTEKFAWEE